MEEILIPIAGIAMIVAIVWIVSSARNRSGQMQPDTFGKLIDKLGTSQEAMAYLESESGQKLLDSVTSGRRNPYSRILGAIGAGVVLTTFGLGLLVLGAVTEEEAAQGGIVMIALGVGFLIAGGVSYKLSKAWGLLDDPQSN